MNRHLLRKELQLVSELEAQINQVVLDVAMCLHKVSVVIAGSFQSKIEKHARFIEEQWVFLAEIDRLLCDLVISVPIVLQNVESSHCIRQGHYQN